MMTSVMPMMMVGRGHSEGVEGRRRRKISAAAVFTAFVQLFKMSTKLVTESGEDFKLLVTETSSDTIGFFFTVSLNFPEKLAPFVTE